jgi:biofilm PGA synthesis N-glycosyltransferase PgaC
MPLATGRKRPSGPGFFGGKLPAPAMTFSAETLLQLVPLFCFAYPFVMAWYWMAGGVFFYWWREKGFNRPNDPPQLDHYPPISILVPCYNESETAIETLTTAHAVDYPEFELIAINDGSRDDTGAILDALAARLPRLRVIHLAENGGKANALNVGALLARNELLLCIDGDALLDRYALRWTAFNFLRADIGAITGNPRIRNRSTLLGRLQVGEFSSIVGLIKRAQTSYGRLFTVSGVIAGFRRRALEDAGWWSSHTLTDDIDVTWRVQLAGWRVVYAPNVMVWILMPETLKGLWRQRVRWAEGGVQMMLDYARPMLTGRAPSLIPIYFNYLLSVLWSYTMLFAFLAGLAALAGLAPAALVAGVSLVPQWWGAVLAVTYLAQATVSHLIEERYEPGMAGSLFWIIWYPLAFWLVATLTTIVALPRVLFRRGEVRGTWVSPDRGLR